VSGPALLAGALVGLGIMLVAFAWYSAKGPIPAAADEEMAAEVAAPEQVKGTFLEGVIDRLTAPLAQQGRASRTADALAKANIPLRAQEWYALRLVVPVLAFLLALLLGAPLIGCVVVAGVVYLIPGLVLRSRRNHRRTDLVRQLPEALQIMSNALQTGASVPQAIHSVADVAPAPIGEEFAKLDRDMLLGIPLDQAMDRAVARIESRDMAMIVSAIQVNRQMGGSLATVLETISGTIRERQKLKDRVRVLTSQVRISTRIVTFLPVGVAIVLFLAAPNYMGLMFSSAVGYVVIGVGIALVAVAYVVMERIVDIEI
jgi:tight adherence protein B